MEYNLIGRTLGGRYEILEIIGNGGMATVYKAKCNLLNRYVAVKVLKETLRSDEEVVKRFITESRAAASMSHHNIVSVYDVGETEEGLNYIVMEYVDGMTLKEYIKRQGRLNWREACEFAYQIARALECAHEHGIIHRDIKPHNIILTNDGTLKVTDFGIARTTTSDTVKMSGGQDVFGSVQYISPEQARGGYVDERSDIYSLGVVLYEMLSGKLPFDGDNPVSVALQKLEGEAEDIREAADDIPDEVADIVMKAIAKEQYVRYQHASDMALELREILDEAAEKPSALKRGKQKMKKSKKKSNNKIIMLAVVLACVLGAVTYLYFSGGIKEYQVPNLMDMTLEEAIAAAENVDFKIDEDKITYETSDEFEEGKIMKQTPGANTYVRRHKAITVVISSGLGNGDIEVPSVIGLDYAKATSELRKLNLKYKKIEETSDKPLNQVVNQTPKSGTTVTENYVVLLHVSNGAGEPSPSPSEDTESIPIPKLVGSTLETAEMAIKSSGLKRGNISKENSDKPVGTVISQSPKAGSESPKGSYVDLVVSAGPGEVQTQTPAATKEPLKKKTLTIQLPQTESGSVHVEVVANGSKIYDKQHQCSEGKVDITVAAKNDATVQVYFDGVLQLTKTVEF